MKFNDIDIELLIGSIFGSMFIILYLALTLSPQIPEDALEVVDRNPNCYVTVGHKAVEVEGVLESCNIEVGKSKGDS